MTISPEKFGRVLHADPARILAFLVEQYGSKIADDVVKRVASNEPTPNVKYPRFT